MTKGFSSYKNEQMRQTVLLASAMKKAADDVSARESFPMLNALAGALVRLQIDVLLAIENGRARKSLQHEMEQALRRGLVEGLRNPKRTFAQTMILGGKDA